MKAAVLSQHLVGTYDGRFVVCQRVPIHRCPACGETYFSSKVAERLERLRRGKILPTEIVTVELQALTLVG
ncbi:MAG: YgiT-type zinc finger protein [Candidatus Latescibacteria bacterium]|nr:YgiT-type zinc finger protein [Candidatus Latescibacterota bacterium]